MSILNEEKLLEIEMEASKLDDISSYLSKWAEIDNVVKNLVKIQEMLKDKAKVFMKERDWKRYNDDKTKVSITISSSKRETIDRKYLEMILSEGQLAQATKITTFERFQIMTPETRKKMKKQWKNKG